MSFTGHQLKGLEGLADAAKSIMKDEPIEEKKLDPVGKADADIDNDGDVDSSDEYLKKRRAAISKAIAKDKEKEEEEVDEAIKADQAPYHPHKDDGEVADVEPSNQLDKDKDDIEVKDGEEEESEEPEVKKESTEIKEGKFKELEGMIGAGMTAKEIIKDLKLKPEKQLIQFLKKMGAK